MGRADTSREVVAARCRSGSEPAPADHRLGVFEPRPRGPAERIGARFRGHPPVWVAAIVWLVGFLVLAVLLIGVGFLLTRPWRFGPIARWDEAVNAWFVVHRTATLNVWTNIGSQLASPITAIAVALAAGIALAIARWWREFGVLALGLTLEASTSLATTFLIARPRPPRGLDPSPGTYSYPSGHAAAAIVLYVGLAVVVGAHTRHGIVKGVAWTAGVVIAGAVAISRVYRGLHYPTDVVVSVFLGTACLLVAMLAVRSASASTGDRDGPARVPRGAGAEPPASSSLGVLAVTSPTESDSTSHLTSAMTQRTVRTRNGGDPRMESPPSRALRGD